MPESFPNTAAQGSPLLGSTRTEPPSASPTQYFLPPWIRALLEQQRAQLEHQQAQNARLPDQQVITNRLLEMAAAHQTLVTVSSPHAREKAGLNGCSHKLFKSIKGVA